MSPSDAVKALEEQLEEAGNELLQPPSSLDQLLPLLDRIENSLSKVEQSPAKSTHTALCPLMKALVADEFLRHPEIDVKVAVASCISEITRITAPDAPYDDNKMKQVFQLIVSAFENLADKSSRSYNKRAMILETVAKVRSCVIMLDLECDELITEMFQIFLRSIRDYHPVSIFTSMETIMSLVVDESEDVSTELLATLLSSTKKDNEEVSPTARRLAERVFGKCAIKLKPYLRQAIKLSGITLDDYSPIVDSVCDGSSEQNNDNASSEQLDARSRPSTASSNKAAQEVKDVGRACQVDPAAANISPKSIVSNGVSEPRKDGTSGQVETVEQGDHLDAEKTTNDEVTPKPESDDSRADESSLLELRLEESAMERGKKLVISTKSIESFGHSSVDGEKESEKLAERKESYEKDSHSSASEDAKHSDKEKDIDDGEGHEGTHIASPFLTDGAADERLPRQGEQSQKIESVVQEEIPPTEVLTEKVSERTSDSEGKSQSHTGKRAPHETANIDKTSGEVGTSKTEDGSTSDSEPNPSKHPGNKFDASDVDEDGSSITKKVDNKKHGRGKASMDKHIMKPSPKDDAEALESTSKFPTKLTKEESRVDEVRTTRKRTPGKGKASEKMKYGENLVGSKIKVWWPEDRMFYEGVIDSFNPVRKKHKVLYYDGDEEILTLRNERWEFIADDSTEEEDEADFASPDVSSEMRKKKKGKRTAETSDKHEPTEISPKRKLKATSMKSGKKSKDDGKSDLKLRDDTTKSGGISEDEIGSKYKAHSQKVGGKSKDPDSNKPKSKFKKDFRKTASKSKEDDPKTAMKSKGNTPQIGNKSSTNGLGKAKSSSSSKVNDGGDVKERSCDFPKAPEGTKRKLSDSSKDRESETKSGKKKQRKS